MTRSLTKWQRVEAALRGDEVDRIPLSLWKHYHLQDRAPRQLAEVTVALHHQFDTDLIKLMPSGLYSIQDWGQLTQTPLAGGLSLDTLLTGSPQEVLAEAREAIAQAGRTGFILAPACVIRGSSPEANLAAARQAVAETAWP